MDSEKHRNLGSWTGLQNACVAGPLTPVPETRFRNPPRQLLCLQQTSPQEPETRFRKSLMDSQQHLDLGSWTGLQNASAGVAGIGISAPGESHVRHPPPPPRRAQQLEASAKMA